MASRQPSTTGQPMFKHSEIKRHSLTKRKELGGSEVEVKDKLRSTELEKFCPHPLFNVLFINETNEDSKEILAKIIDTSREYEDISYLTFITYEEVANLTKDADNAVLPPQIKSLLTTISKKLNETVKEDETIPLEYLGQLVKLKLIEVMYSQYAQAVKKMQQRRKLMTDLKTLVDDYRQDKNKDKLSRRTAESKPLSSKIDLIKKKEKEVAIDYTTVPIQTDDDIVFDDDLNHHVSFYVFTGFYEPELLKEVIVNNELPIQSILKFTAQFSSTEQRSDLENSSLYSNFWDQTIKYFYGPDRQEFSENTFLMNYTAAGSDTKRMLEGLLSVVRNISEIKLQHLNYIRHMVIVHDKEIYSFFPLECLTVYQNSVQNIPVELVNVPVVLDSLLKQVCVSVDEILPFPENNSQQSYLDLNGLNTERNSCLNPCSFDAFVKRRSKVRPQPLTLSNFDTSFIVHENDELTKILNSYKKYGPLVHDITIKMLKLEKPISDLCEIKDDHNEIVHKHHRDPSTTKAEIDNKDTLLHFMYLFLFSCFSYKDDVPIMQKIDIAKNLELEHKLHYFNTSRPKIIKSDVIIEEEEDTFQGNLYNTPVTAYFWKEKLKSTVLLQEISKAYNDYLYCERRYSPETQTLLLQFTNGLNDFGINTKIYQQPLLTAVCLRDFCRYDIVQQAEWLKRNKAPRYVRKYVLKERCQGAQKLMSSQVDPEYRHLIETGKDQDPVHIQINNKDYEEITFEELIDQIKCYPPNTKLTKECSKVSTPRFLVYDLGTKYFHVKGARTIFQSHDDVILTVDNTKLYDEYPKCSITLSSRNNSLILHSGKYYQDHNYNFHINTSDGTIISYHFLRQKKTQKHQHSKKNLKEGEPSRTEKPIANIATTLNLDKTPSIECDEKVRSVDRQYFESVVQTTLLNEEFENSNPIVYMPTENILERLKEAVTTHVPVYKVNSNMTYIKKLQPELDIPLSNIVKSVLHATMKAEEKQSVIRKYLPVEERAHESEKPIDIRITLPNGLYITFYPSQLKKGYFEVKQEYLHRNPATEEEEFRLFTRGGYNMIKLKDGCITTLKSNGDTLKHEKFNSETIGKMFTGPCHCKTIKDYIRRANKILKHTDEEATAYAISRRSHFHTKKGSVNSPDTIDVMMRSKIPYLKNTCLKFDGSRVSLEAGKVRVKKVLHTSFENNFPQQEVYYERGDGFRSTFDKNGSQMVQFVDGTKITSSVHVSKTLADGYVYISLEFKYEHPNYATVFYTAMNSLEVHLNNNVVFTLDLENSSVNFDGDITTTVDNKSSILFEKSCGKCGSKYTCDINIKPLVKGKMVFSDEFLHAQDSYNKHFYCDYEGTTERNEDFIKGPNNSLNCDHYSDMSYKKLFVVNRDLSGSTFWTDKMVLTKKKAMVGDPYCTVKEYSDISISKIPMYKFKKQIFDHYCSRFLITSSLDYKEEPWYSTFRVLKRMLDDGILEKFYGDLSQFLLRPENSANPYYFVLERMIKENIDYKQSFKEIVVVKSMQVAVQADCKCVKKRLSISDKIKNWRSECEKYRELLRNQKIPCYFDSPFCKTLRRFQS